jgi:hypothetical protein
MEELDLGVPQPILDSLPEDGANAGRDMREMAAGLQRQLNETIADADDEAAAAAAVVDAIEHLESRFERYDEFVPELRAWGQSPIYAIAWRNLCADLVGQLYEVEWLAPHVDRERNSRLVADGIRFGKR